MPAVFGTRNEQFLSTNYKTQGIMGNDSLSPPAEWIFVGMQRFRLNFWLMVTVGVRMINTHMAVVFCSLY